MTDDHVARLRAFLDAWHETKGSSAIAMCEPDPAKLYALRAADLRAALDELEQLRAEVDQLRHDSKRCAAVHNHQLYGPRRCELPIHASEKHHAGLPGGWVEWPQAPESAPQQSARDSLCGNYSRPGFGGVLGPCIKAPGHDDEWHVDAGGAAWEPERAPEAGF